MFLGGGGAGDGVRWTVQLESLETHSELAADLLWVGCQLTPHLDQHSVQILSELAADPISVGCQSKSTQIGSAANSERIHSQLR